MSKMNILMAAMVLSLVGASTSQAQITGPGLAMSFFVTSAPMGNGGNLGGLAGADKYCASLAAAVDESTRIKTWRAYLSTQGTDVVAGVNARDRIGRGPWYNAKGVLVANNLTELHGDTLELARLGNNLNKTTVLTEKGTTLNGFGDTPNVHDILTGSQPDGTAYPMGADRTCRNWTSNTGDAAQVGHFDRNGGGNYSWNSAHTSKGCSQPNLVATGGAGYIYCFATN